MRHATHLETGLLAAILICLPLFEAPKNAFGLLLLLAYLGQSLRLRNFGRASPFEWPILGLIALLWIAPLTSTVAGQIDLFEEAQRWTALGLVVLIAGRLSPSRGQMTLLIFAVLMSGMAAVGDGLYRFHSFSWVHPEIRSIGAVNHSAMYVIILLAVGLGALLSRERALILAGGAAVIAAWAFLLPSRSIVSIATALLLTIIWAGLALRGIGARAQLGVALGALVVALAVIVSPFAKEARLEVIGKAQSGIFLAYRDAILRSAWEVADRNLILGSGARSFQAATDPAILAEELASEGRDYAAEAGRFYHADHGHNLWTTILVERGLVGIFLICALLAIYLWYFARAYGRIHDPFWRGLAMAGLLIAAGFAINGLGNTTMQNEHGQTGMMLLALLAAAFARAKPA